MPLDPPVEWSSTFGNPMVPFRAHLFLRHGPQSPIHNNPRINPDIYAELSTIMISAGSLRFSVLRYARTLQTTINLPFPIIVPYGAVLMLS